MLGINATLVLLLVAYFLYQRSGRAPEIRLTQSPSPSPLPAFPAIAAGADLTARDCLNMSQNLSSPK